MNYEGFVIEKAMNEGVTIKAFKNVKEFSTYVAKDFQEAITVLQEIINAPQTQEAQPVDVVTPTEPETGTVETETEN